MAQKKNIVFIHGLFQNPKSWKRWHEYFEAKGFSTSAPAYPYHDGEPSSLRSKIDPALSNLTLGGVVESLSRHIETFSEPPILIGHSMGGLIVQKLIAQKIGTLGICIDSAPPKGIFSFEWSFLKANLPTINPFKGNSVCVPTVEWFHYAFCNTMTLEETTKEFEQYVVPESRNIPRSSTMKDGAIDFSQPHAPLLFIAGEKDHIIPASLNRKNYQAYTHPKSITDFQQFAGRTHYLCGQKNWEEIASFCQSWIGKNLS